MRLIGGQLQRSTRCVLELRSYNGNDQLTELIQNRDAAKQGGPPSNTYASIHGVITGKEETLVG